MRQFCKIPRKPCIKFWERVEGSLWHFYDNEAYFCCRHTKYKGTSCFTVVCLSKGKYPGLQSPILSGSLRLVLSKGYPLDSGPRSLLGYPLDLLMVLLFARVYSLTGTWVPPGQMYPQQKREYCYATGSSSLLQSYRRTSLYCRCDRSIFSIWNEPTYQNKVLVFAGFSWGFYRVFLLVLQGFLRILCCFCEFL